MNANCLPLSHPSYGLNLAAQTVKRLLLKSNYGNQLPLEILPSQLSILVFDIIVRFAHKVVKSMPSFDGSVFVYVLRLKLVK